MLGEAAEKVIIASPQLDDTKVHTRFSRSICDITSKAKQRQRSRKKTEKVNSSTIFTKGPIKSCSTQKIKLLLISGLPQVSCRQGESFEAETKEVEYGYYRKCSLNKNDALRKCPIVENQKQSTRSIPKHSLHQYHNTFVQTTNAN